MEKRGKQGELVGEMIASAPADKVFPLLCPVREFDWLEYWKCEVVHTDSGYAEEGCIFRTWFPGMGGKDTWVVSRHEPDTLVEFIRMNQSRVMRYRITLHPKGSSTRLVWHQKHTSLDEMGEHLVENLDKDAYARQVKYLENCLNHYLRTGEKLPMSGHG